MTPEQLIAKVSQLGGKLVAGPGGLRLRTQKPLPAQLVEELRRHKLEIIAAIHGLRLEEVRERAGPDWPDVLADPELLDVLARAIALRRMRERGEVPASYVSVTVCRRCGTVPIFAGAPDRIDGCPWCALRLRGLPVPRPPGVDKPHRCGEFSPTSGDAA